MSEYYREEWWLQVGLSILCRSIPKANRTLQSHDLQEVQIRVLLGVYGYDFDTPQHLFCPDPYVYRSLG